MAVRHYRVILEVDVEVNTDDVDMSFEEIEDLLEDKNYWDAYASPLSTTFINHVELDSYTEEWA